MTQVRCWRDQAACLEVVSADYDPFFSDAKDLQAEAITICATCPVRDACLTFAVRTGQQYGIWGGQLQQTIRRLIALERAGRPPEPPGAREPSPGEQDPLQARPSLQRREHLLAPDGQRRCRTCLREAQPTRARRRRRGGNSDVA
jgi:WhiB family transcriptional regulator, redox-sensing transcriptional regulator